MFDTLIPDMARKRALISPNTTAFQDGTQDWSFAQINTAADAMGRALLAQGLHPGDRLALLCLNRVEFFIALFACQKTGIILCPLNWRQPTAELIDTLTPVGIHMLIYSAEFAQTGQEVAQALQSPAFTVEDDVQDWISHRAAPFTALIPAQQTWYLLFTSGTTGRPKAVIQTAEMCWANAVNIGQAIGLSASDTSVNYLPLFHTAGINLHTLPVFLFGGCSRILPKFDTQDVLDLFRAGQISQFLGVPAIYQAFSLAKDLDQIDWSRVTLSCGGAALPESLIRAFADMGATVLNGFGMTETGPTVFLMSPEAAQAKIGSVGRPQMLTEVRLDGVPDHASGAGELQIRGPNITPGYFMNPRATRDSFTPDGWLKSGDVARRDEDGYFYIVDRIKDMYISGGENVYPAEVERILHSHDAVLEASVIGVPDDKWGESGAAFIMLHPDQAERHGLTPEALQSWCRAHLAAYKIPAHIRFVDDFPRTAAGKVRKPDLKALYDQSY